MIYLGNGLFRTFWGFLYDRIGFKKIMIVVFILNIICSCSIYFIITSKPLMVLFGIVISALAGAPFALLPTVTQKIFGIKYHSEVYGGTFYCFGFSAFLSPIISEIVGVGSATTPTPYLGIYMAGGVLSLIGLVLVIMLSLKKYTYHYY